MSRSIPPIEVLVPHRPPMRFLDQMEQWTPDYVICSAQIRAASPFVVDGELRAVITLEHMAQSVAAYIGYEAWLQNRPVMIGMIVACPAFEIDRPTLHVGEQLTVCARYQQGDAALSKFCAEVLVADEAISRAELTVVQGGPLAV